jgi:glyoxylase-like metal-dependent hydrolase (beta-lactamase superfamily II)
VGTNQKFIDAGATVIALEALKTDMASDARTKDIPGRPTQTFAKDYVLKFGGAEVDAHSYGRGHTGDDTMVYFPDLKVVMVSDQMTDANPIVDFANGGSAVEWNRSLDGVLKLDFDMAIPGRGEPKTRAEVQAFRDKFATLLSRASDAIKAGATRDTLAMQVKTDDLGWTFNAAFYGSLYDELAKK